MLVGGVKKSTMEGIQLRGDINVCLRPACFRALDLYDVVRL